MKKTSKMRTVFLLGFLVALSAPANAQNISEKLCNTIFDSVGSLMKPTKIYRRNIYTTDCVFEFDADKQIGASLSIEQHENEKKSRKSFSEDSKDFYGDRRKNTRIPSFTSVKHWDDVGLFLSERKHDTFLLIRKNRFVIRIFSEEQKTLLQIETLMRGINFE